MLGWILCGIKGHKWRRAHKGDDPKMKYCQRCTATLPVRARKVKHVSA